MGILIFYNWVSLYYILYYSLVPPFKYAFLIFFQNLHDLSYSKKFISYYLFYYDLLYHFRQFDHNLNFSYLTNDKNFQKNLFYIVATARSLCPRVQEYFFYFLLTQIKFSLAMF